MTIAERSPDEMTDTDTYRAALHGTGGIADEVIALLKAVTTTRPPETRWLVGFMSNMCRGKSKGDAYVLLNAAKRLADLEAALVECRRDFERIARTEDSRVAFETAMSAECRICATLGVPTRFVG